MIIMTAAMKQETQAIRRCLERPAPLTAGDCPAWRGTCGEAEALAVCTGIGQARVEAGLGGLLARHRAEAVVSVGFGGALTPDLRAGDIVICETTTTDDGGGRYFADEGLLRRAVEAMAANGHRWLRATGVTIPMVAADGPAKLALRERTGASICEMEDAMVARLAGAQGLPFLAVRVVLDELETDFSDFTGLVTARGIRPLRVAAFFTAHPGRLLTVIKSYQRAKDSISKFVTGFLDNRAIDEKC
jgi:adenosylhomocysteine nucleosidase